MSLDTRTHVHALIDQLPPKQLEAVETLLESMLDPLARKLASAPIEDETISEEEQRSVAEAIEWSKHHKPIPLEEVLSDLGLTMADWEEMGKTALSQEENGVRNG